MATRKSALISSALTLVAFVGCGIMFAPDKHVSRTVEKSELVGNWTLTSQSLGYLKSDGYDPGGEKKHEFTLLDDGTCTLTSVYDNSDFPYVDGSGVWTIKDGKKVEIEIDANDRSYTFHFGIGEKRGRLYFWQFHGDPDMWEFIEYNLTNAK